MPVLRSREIIPPNSLTKAGLKHSKPEPVTPARTCEPSLPPTSHSPKSVPTSGSPARRRSVRLAFKSPAENGPVHDQNSTGRRKRVKMSVVESEDHVVDGNSNREIDADEKLREGAGLPLKNGGSVGKRKMECNGAVENGVKRASTGRGRWGKKKAVGKGESEEGEEIKAEMEGEVEKKDQDIEEIVDEVGGMLLARRRYSWEEKGKGKMDGEDVMHSVKVELASVHDGLDDSFVREVKGEDLVDSVSRDEKGKQKMYSEDMSDSFEAKLGSVHSDLVDSLAPEVMSRNVIRTGNKKVVESRMEQFRDIARQNAARFAHFEAEEEPEEKGLAGGVETGMPATEEEQKVEDWPGPFSTGMKIIRDRMNKLNSPQGSANPEKAKAVPIVWVPGTNKGGDRMKKNPTSLQELSLRVLVKNANAITSLQIVPDVLKHKMCELLCDSRRMSSHILGLLVCGSPTEIRVRDCSWLSEEDFTICFEGCDIGNLTVLQLDQCGRCMADYVILATLAQSSGSLPALTTLSLRGACRLSDIGLRSLVSSAPALRSINLSQCSLLTSTSIDILADSLGSVLRELYLEDCQSIDAMLILPALKKLKLLEVLSLSRLQSVSDVFIKEFIVANGHNMKELLLTDCVKLTDSSIKVIADACCNLCALDLVNLRKLTDSSLGYLVNGCREIHTLKLCRNAFSDEAIAAFVETSGELLKELSLNNVKQVGNCTALSLARRCRKLLNLDLSWCRNLTDEAFGSIVEGCPSLRVLKVFGCSQITRKFLDGHSNPGLQIIGSKMSNLLEHVRVPQE